MSDLAALAANGLAAVERKDRPRPLGRRFNRAFRNFDTRDPVQVTVEVQPGLLALLAHAERLDAARAGRQAESPERVLSQHVSNHLENLLHAFAADPTSHPHFAAIWNGLCADAGAPELVVPNSERAAKDIPPAVEGPF